MWHPARYIAGLLIAFPLVVAATGTPESELMAAEDARFHAVLSHDGAALERAIADDVVYSHMTGKREGKAEVIQGSLRATFTGIEPSERRVRVIGEVGIIRGKIARQLPDRTLTDGYLAVYALRDGRWQLLEWVSANTPPQAEPSK